jgi:hypothetical protein
VVVVDSMDPQKLAELVADLGQHLVVTVVLAEMVEQAVAQHSLRPVELAAQAVLVHKTLELLELLELTDHLQELLELVVAYY